MTAECIHSMNPAWCGVCRGETKPPSGTGSTIARHVGKCPGCGEWIREGERIFLADDREWVCGRRIT